MKVSVIVPTYRTPQESLDRLVASLDAQSLPQEDFEVIFVDDGSPDDTADRLHAIADERDNYRVILNPNSGWPSKPRNTGMDAALGDYIAFIDHDDVYYPDALRAAYEFAVANGSDVVNGKEAYTFQPDWGLGTYKGDLAQAVGRTDTHALLPMNPHKLYRAAFLREHDIRFIEGARVLWEDQFFNLAVAKHAKVISTLASTPFYHWFQTKGGGSDTAFAKWADAYWHWYRRVLEATVDATTDTPQEQDQLMRTQYVNRVLGAFDRSFSKRSDEARQFIFDNCRALQEDFDLRRFDSTLPPSARSRAHLLRTGTPALMGQLCAEDQPSKPIPEATDLRWEGDQLVVSGTVQWTRPDGTPITYVREEDRLVLPLSDELRAAIPLEARDMTSHVKGASAGMILRHRESRVAWTTPTEATLELVASGEDAQEAVVTFTAAIDPHDAAMGKPLAPGYWDLFQSSRLQSRSTTLTAHLPASIVIEDGRLQLIYSNDSGNATIFIDGELEAVRRLAPVAASLSGEGEIQIELAGSHDGGGEVQTTVGIAEGLTGKPSYVDHPAILTVADGRALLRFHATDGDMRVRVGDKAVGNDEPWLPVSLLDGRLYEDGLPIQPEPPLQPVAVAPVAEHSPRTPSNTIRVLLLTNRDSDNVGDQLIEASAISLIQGVMKNLGIPRNGYSINSRAAAIIPKKYMTTGDPADLADARKTISETDVIVFGGAPLFNYSYQSFYRRTIETILLAEEYGVPILFSSIGVEPFNASSPKSLALKEALALPAVRQITTRDDISSLEKYVAGTDTAVAHVSDPAVFADVVFRPAPPQPKTTPPAKPLTRKAALKFLVPTRVKKLVRRLRPAPTTPAQKAAAPSPAPAKQRQKRIGLVVTRAGIFKDNGINFSPADQRKFWLDVIEQLKKRGYDYRLFTTGHFADEALLDLMVRSDKVPVSKTALTVNSPEELHAQLSACDGVIAYRLHASIASFAYGIPSIGLSWNFKVPYFYESVGHGDRALGPERWTADEVVPALEKAMAEGVHKDEAFLRSVYETLFDGFKSIVAPDSEAVAYSYDQLRTELPRYAGTSDAAYKEKVRRKLRRTYDAYRRAAY